MAFENTYSGVDQLLHRLAFATLSSQTSLADLETRLNRKRLRPISVDRPVFVTALPRAGTTLLLELMVNSGEFVSHTYRDMPFLLLPMLWQRFARLFKQDDQPRERAHGDGMLVSLDSPEAFEEIIWRHFWPKHYQAYRIAPWVKSKNAGFERFFIEHLQKIIALRCGAEYHGQRYISKNNLNVSRLPYLARLFPDANILVPFRNPLQHAQSLLRQHRNFLDIHRQDAFAKAYMRDIGHYDFGDNLKPVDFNGWLGRARYSNPLELNFWLEYWLEAYRYVLELELPQVVLFEYDALCRAPGNGLARIADCLRMQEPERLTAQAERLSLARPHTAEDPPDAALMNEIELLQQRLRESALALS